MESWDITLAISRSLEGSIFTLDNVLFIIYIYLFKNTYIVSSYKWRIIETFIRKFRGHPNG